MRSFAVIALGAWIVASIVFADWKRHVDYPERTGIVRFTSSLYELLFAALAVWVIASG